MSEPPLVSILMPVYNHERYVVQAIESALRQADDHPVERLEIVVVDDGSTDRTAELIAPYEDRIRAIRKPNGGLLCSVNRLLEEARGELLCFLAGDDFLRPGKVARQASVLAKRSWASLVYGDSAVVDGDGKVEHESYHALHSLPIRVGDIRGPLLEKNFICAPTAMVRANLRERCWPIGPPAVWDDWWMWFHAAEAGQALYVPGPDVCYRVHDANMSAGLDAERHQRFIAQELPFRRWLLTETDHTGIPYGDVLSAWRAFEWHAHTCVAAGLGSFDELVPVGEDEAAASVATLAGGPTDPAELVRRLLRALAWNPHCAPARTALPTALAAAEQAAPPLLTNARIVLALAVELLHEPALLAAYAEAFRAQDEVLLRIDARSLKPERLAEELIPLAMELGIDEAGGPDVLVVDDGRAWPREHLRAVLTRDPGTAVALGAPQVSDARSLREQLGALSPQL